MLALATAVPMAAMAAGPAPIRPWLAEQNDAVLLARRGDTAAALPTLERLRREHPEDVGLARDVIVISVWAGRDRKATRLFAALPPTPQPDYVVEAVALAHRHLNQPAEALDLYRQGLRQSPNNSSFAAGEIRSLVDLAQAESAIARADADLQAHGERGDVLLAAGYAAMAQKKPVEALRYIDRAVARDPKDHAAKHDRILAIDDMGAPQVARRLAEENPGVMTEAEQRRIDGNAAAALVRWGVFEPANEASRFTATDRAIATLDGLIARWSHDGDAARGDVLRARFDRMVALRDRVRMTEVLAEYDDLRRQDATVPNYALLAAGDAYLYLRQPEAARDLYRHGLDVDPRNSDTRLALFYAYVDLDDFAAAYAQVDHAAADQAVWLYLKGLKDPVENPERATADLAAGNARLYADELAEAHRRVTAMAQAAPNNTRFLTALANIESARGWPRLAAEDYEISRAIKPRDVAAEIGQAGNNLQLRDYRAVETQLADVKGRFPENLEVQRLDRLWQVHNMAEFSLTVEQGVHATSNVQGGKGLALTAQLHSQPIDYNWRAFVTESIAHETLTEGEGSVTLRRSAVGAEYRGRDVVGSLEGTMTAYGQRTGATLRSGIDHGRAGVRALAAWSLTDNWQVGGSAELFARDTPLRALRNGVTANAVSTSVTYRESESTVVALAGEAMSFSDGNSRSSLTGQLTQRLVTEPRFTIDGIVGLGGSRNSADGNRPYYNPRQDSLATVGLSINQAIYRRYQLIYDHHLAVTSGVYWERGFGSHSVANVLYEHRIQSNDVFEAGLGVNVSHQPYDGVYQNTVAVLFNLRWKFLP